MSVQIKCIAVLLGIMGFALCAHSASSIIYSHSFSGSGSTPLVGVAPDVAPGSETWMGTPVGSQWTADGSITNSTYERRNMFLPFTPEPGKIYTLKVDVVRIGTLHTFNIGFVQNANFTGGFPLVADNVGASPWMNSAAINGNVSTFMGPNADGPGAAQSTVPNANAMNTLEMVLNTENAAWTVDFRLNGTSIRTNTFAVNPTINYVGIGRYNQGTFTVDNFELSVEVTSVLSLSILTSP